MHTPLSSQYNALLPKLCSFWLLQHILMLLIYLSLLDSSFTLYYFLQINTTLSLWISCHTAVTLFFFIFYCTATWSLSYVPHFFPLLTVGVFYRADVSFLLISFLFSITQLISFFLIFLFYHKVLAQMFFTIKFLCDSLVCWSGFNIGTDSVTLYIPLPCTPAEALLYL